MEQLEAVGHFRFDEDKLNEVRAIINECVRITKEKDVGTLQYDWLLSDSHREVVVREKYADSAALLSHATNVAACMSKLQALATVSIEVYGEPSAPLQATLNQMGVQVLRKISGI